MVICLRYSGKSEETSTARPVGAGTRRQEGGEVREEVRRRSHKALQVTAKVLGFAPSDMESCGKVLRSVMTCSRF